MVTTSTLEIDSPEARRLAAVDPDGPNEEETVEIRDKMHSFSAEVRAATSSICGRVMALGVVSNWLRATRSRYMTSVSAVHASCSSGTIVRAFLIGPAPLPPVGGPLPLK